MCSVTVIFPLALVVRAYANGAEANHNANVLGSIDKMIDKLFGRALNAWPLRGVDVDHATFGKPSHPAIPSECRGISYNRPFATRCSYPNSINQPLIAWPFMQPARASLPQGIETQRAGQQRAVHQGATSQAPEPQGSMVEGFRFGQIFKSWTQDKTLGHGAHDRSVISQQALRNDAVSAGIPTLGHELLDELTSKDNVASTMQDRRGLKNTEELQREVLKSMSATLGPEHPDTLTSKSNLALILQAHGDLKGVEELQREVLEARNRTLGPDHPDTLGVKNSLATILLAGGDVKAAGELHKEVLNAISRTLGAEHPEKRKDILAHSLQVRPDSKAVGGLQKEVPKDLEDHGALLPESAHGSANGPLSPTIANLNKALVNSLKGAIDIMYRSRDIQRFYVLETIARVPYFAYVSCLHLHESMGKRGLTKWLRLHYAEADNELHHLLIMEALGGSDAYIDRFFAQHIAFFYYWYCVAIYLLHPRAAYHLSELIEEHAFHTYDAFMEAHRDELRKLPVPDIAREYYGGRDVLESYLRKANGEESPRELQSLYDVFAEIRNDEGTHWRTLHDLVEHDDANAPPAVLSSITPKA